MRKSILILALSLVLLLTFGINVQAQQKMPQQGTTNFVTYYTARILSNLNMGEIGSEALVEMLGVTRNTDGQKLFDNMAVRCIVYRETVGGKYKAKGACTETDSDGDKTFTTFDSVTMIHTLIGGTGKYKGISGTEPYTVKMLPAPGEGMSAFIADHKASWQFK